MTDPTLAEVASDVAQALGLKKSPAGEWYYSGRAGDECWLVTNGSNLTDPYWFWRCCEWLSQNCWDIQLGSDGFHEAWNDKESVAMNGPIPMYLLSEAPARLVSAVFRRMQK